MALAAGTPTLLSSRADAIVVFIKTDPLPVDG